ncbi:hypothetical protein [Ilyobacter polytropus]|jgi:hypothetical protein|uniref:DUF4376 domain-containing protein n=1 Tax=Ilyobacter polytropus (strain ATCC 51220 / DSM 2926 / LMG 16218 / CuHBu1) TaxID=572544 RepID=E3HBK1_ILYPC|nr:hypothetical protein [Ilyobacter polytropus]ADO83697.1 hypothetical protein Ilyop_1926 [Ilyobacter polytropus DSM 2926]
MSKKLYIMYHKTEKDSQGCAKKIRDCSYGTEEFESIYGGDYKKMFPEWGDLPEYDSEVHCIYYGEVMSCPTVDDGIVREMNTAEKFKTGLISLGEGEMYQNGEVVNIDKPSNYHTWDVDSQTYILTEEKETEWKEFLINSLADKRDTMLKTGTTFEETKIIKGRTQDLADARACKDELEEDGSTFWAFSSGEIENPITDPARINTIYRAIGAFRSSQFFREAELKVAVYNLDESGLLKFNTDQIW